MNSYAQTSQLAWRNPSLLDMWQRIQAGRELGRAPAYALCAFKAEGAPLPQAFSKGERMNYTILRVRELENGHVELLIRAKSGLIFYYDTTP